jgi:hypothetical protein
MLKMLCLIALIGVFYLKGLLPLHDCSVYVRFQIGSMNRSI